MDDFSKSLLNFLLSRNNTFRNGIFIAFSVYAIKMLQDNNIIEFVIKLYICRQSNISITYDLRQSKLSITRNQLLF